jgi:hypothetical protein
MVKRQLDLALLICQSDTAFRGGSLNILPANADFSPSGDEFSFAGGLIPVTHWVRRIS